jgi:hypothetical protein
MSPRIKKILVLLLAVPLLFAAGRIENALNRDRATLGLTFSAPLQNAPPVLAFTTVALGGLRGLICNYLWIRSNDLQQDDKFFEAAQLASWITDLEPHFSQVWEFQGWNMAYNISVKFKENGPGDYADRWRWVQNGIELLRDQGLLYNPDDVGIHFQLAWIFQHKMGQNLDDGNLYYKQQWAQEMTPFFGTSGTNLENLLHPQTADEVKLVETLTNKYKIFPAFAEKVNEEYGPLDWRLAETHGIYWAAQGLQKAKEHPAQTTGSDLMMLRRVIFQSMQEEFRHGRLISNPFTHSVELAPNLEIIPKVNDAYLQMMAESDAGDSNSIARAGYKNFLRDAVYFLYINNHVSEAQHWFDYLGKRYPDQPLLDNDPKSLAKNLTLDDYAFDRVQEDIGETSLERVTSAIEALLQHAYEDLAIGQNDRAAGYLMLSQKVYDRYQNKMGSDQKRVTLPPMNDLKRDVLHELLDPQEGLPFAARAAIRTQLRMPPETTNNVPFAISTNTVPVSTTNAPATNSVGK